MKLALISLMALFAACVVDETHDWSYVDRRDYQTRLNVPDSDPFLALLTEDATEINVTGHADLGLLWGTYRSLDLGLVDRLPLRAVPCSTFVGTGTNAPDRLEWWPDAWRGTISDREIGPPLRCYLSTHPGDPRQRALFVDPNKGRVYLWIKRTVS